MEKIQQFLIFVKSRSESVVHLVVLDIPGYSGIKLFIRSPPMCLLYHDIILARGTLSLCTIMRLAFIQWMRLVEIRCRAD